MARGDSPGAPRPHSLTVSHPRGVLTSAAVILITVGAGVLAVTQDADVLAVGFVWRRAAAAEGDHALRGLVDSRWALTLAPAGIVAATMSVAPSTPWFTRDTAPKKR